MGTGKIIYSEVKKTAETAIPPITPVIEAQPKAAADLQAAAETLKDLQGKLPQIVDAVNSQADQGMTAAEGGAAPGVVSPTPATGLGTSMEETVGTPQKPESTEAQNTNAAAAPAPEAKSNAVVKSASQLELSCHLNLNKGFDDSYFVATQGDEMRMFKMSKVYPVALQARMLEHYASTKGELPSDIKSPHTILAELSAQGMNSLELFDAAMSDLEHQAVEANQSQPPITQTATVVKTAAPVAEPLQAMNTAEIKKDKVKAGDVPVVAVKSDDKPAAIPGDKSKGHGGEYGSKMWPKTTDQQAPMVAINRKGSVLETSLKDTVRELRSRLAAVEVERDTAKAEASDSKKALDTAMGDAAKRENVEKLDSLVEDLESKGLISEGQESEAIALLTKIDTKSLPHLIKLLELISGSKSAAPKKAEHGMKPISQKDADDAVADILKMDKGAAPVGAPVPLPKKAALIPQPVLTDAPGGLDPDLETLHNLQ